MATIPAPEFHNWISGHKSKFLFVPPGDDPVTDDRFLFDIEQATFDHTVDTDDITHTGADGAQDVIDTIERASGSVTFVYDASNDFSVDPNVFRIRGKAWIILQPDGLQEYYFFALFTSGSFSIGPKAGAVRVTVNYMSKGKIFSPTTSQPPVTSST